MAEYQYDPAGDLERLKRKRLAAARLGEQVWNQYPALHDAGPLKVANWGDAVAQVGKAWASKRADDELTRDEVATRSAQQVYENDQMRQYNEAKSPRDVVSTAGGEGDDAVSTTKRMPGDMKKALAVAMNSRMPQLLEQARKEDEERRKLLSTPGATIASRAAAYDQNDPTQLRSDVKQTVVNNQAFATTDEGIAQQPGLDARDKFKTIPTPPGANPGQVWQQNTGTNKIDAEGSVPSTTVNVDTKGANAFEVAAMGDWQKRLADNKTRVQEIAARAPILREALKVIPNAETGFGANPILDIRAFAKKFGIADDEAGKIADSQMLRSAIAPNVFEMLKALRPASNVDLEWSKTVQAADLANDPRTLERAIQTILASSANEVNQAQADFSSFTASKPDLAATAGLYKPLSVSFSDADGIVPGPDGRFVPKHMQAGVGNVKPGAPAGPEQLSGPGAPAPGTVPKSALPPELQKELDELREWYRTRKK